MQVATFEGVVTNGQIHLNDDVNLPESARVYVILPDVKITTAKILSPRLVNKADAKIFDKTIEVEFDDEI